MRMSFGSSHAVQMEEDRHREKLAEIIASRAAALVAARDMGRAEAIEVAKESVRRDQEEDSDVTGTLAVENEYPTPSKIMPSDQIARIKSELMDAAQEAAEDL
jgi:hypothetical protein